MQNTFTLSDSTPSPFLLLLPRLSSTMGATTCAFFHTLCGLRGRFFYFFLSIFFPFFLILFSFSSSSSFSPPPFRPSEWLFVFWFFGVERKSSSSKWFLGLRLPVSRTKENTRTCFREWWRVGLPFSQGKVSVSCCGWLCAFPGGEIQIRSWCWVIIRI